MKPYSSRLGSKDIKRSPINQTRIRSPSMNLSTSYEVQSAKSSKKLNSYSSILQDLKISLNETNKSQVSTVIETSPKKRRSTKSETFNFKGKERMLIENNNLKVKAKKKRVTFKQPGEFVKIINIESFKKYYANEEMGEIPKKEKISCKCLVF